MAGSALTSLRPLVICGPSGCGKSTLLNYMFTEFPDNFGFSVSHTTRKPRPSEINGKHYHFTDKETMETAIADGKFIENAVYSGNMYGTSKEAVETVQKEGKVCVLDIDVQGVKQVRKTTLQPWYIFIKPPSLDELEKRLRARNTETEESLAQRLNNAKHEIEYGISPGNFDFILINDNLELACQQLKDFIQTKVLLNQNGLYLKKVLKVMKHLPFQA